MHCHCHLFLPEMFAVSRSSSSFIPLTAMVHPCWPPLCWCEVVPGTGGTLLDLWMRQKMHYGLLWLADRSHSNSELLTKGPGPSSNNGSTPTPLSTLAAPFSWSWGTFGGRAESVPRILVLLLHTGDEQQAYWLDFLCFKEGVADHQEGKPERRNMDAGLLIQMERSPWGGEVGDLLQSIHRQLFRGFRSNGMYQSSSSH